MRSHTKIAPKRKTQGRPSHVKIDVQGLFADENGLKIVESLLSSVDPSKITPAYSLKIISKLSDLVNHGKVKITDFDQDDRYKALCSQLSTKPRKKSVGKLTDTVEQEIQNSNQQLYEKKLGFFFDMNEIQKIAEKSNMSINHAVQIMSKLAFHKSRVVPVLQSLANHIVQSNREINIKIASDILYNMAVLNFYDEVLIEKIASGLVSQISKTDKKHSAVIGSLSKSIGILRYRNENLLIQLTAWMLENSKSARPQEICSFLVTLAVVGYSPLTETDKLKEFADNLKESDMVGAEDWLDVVWALVVLNLANEAQVLSVLDKNFLSRLSDVQKVSESKKRKLLNILSVAKLIFKQDTGQFFEENAWVLEVTLERSKEKLEFVKAIITSLHALLPTNGCLKTNVNTGMGFALDAEFYVDKKCNPVLVNQIESKEKQALRLGVVPQSYYDFCRGDEQIIGPVLFHCELLRLSGYHVISIPYTEFELDRKVVERVKYLRDKIKATVEQCSV
ncbi:FAST kinase domain-containing protein 4 [Belonocnema kinseyi]|uniref:FAST kinase domain-containing protein 4 n=1 Tax=Belonocnema kinseyi TaxID=2817044 RepID=UPI00143D41FE|nr:FAST kinase domain-containing protein 4 [Belonocnema kinseyi]